jgi:hypothetical protein
VSVGVPVTVTASFMLRVRVTFLPAFRCPLDGDCVIESSVGVVVSICNVPAMLFKAPAKLVALPAPSVTVAELRLTAVTPRSGVFWFAATA